MKNKLLLLYIVLIIFFPFGLTLGNACDGGQWFLY